VTFNIAFVPSSSRDFKFTTDIGTPSSFTLNRLSPTQTYVGVLDGFYQVTLPSSETTGYDVAVSCVGSATTSGQTTALLVFGDITCTFTLTGMSSTARTPSLSLSLSLSQRSYTTLDHPPTIVCPSDITTVNDKGACYAVVKFDPIVRDSNPDAMAVCIPSSGDRFRVGSKEVTCSAVDNAGQSSTQVLSLVIAVSLAD
jgi:hypothetical protein